MKGSRPFKIEEIEKIKSQFTGTMKTRNLSLFLLGANTGFRISELLSLTLGDVLEQDGTIKNRLTVWKRNMKGNQSSRTVLLNKSGKKGLLPWLIALKNINIIHKDDYIFISCQGKNKPIGRTQAWKIFDKVFKAAGFTGKLGTHAMRKTFANQVYSHFLSRAASGEKIDAFRATSKSLGHTDIKSTDQYLSFLTEEIDETIEAVGI